MFGRFSRKRGGGVLRACAIFVAMLALLPLPGDVAASKDARLYDIVIEGGRVIDPETNLDAIRHVGVADGRIAIVSETPLAGRTVIDAKGLVVGPGFVDLHSHAQNVPSAWLQAFDGVTTALELELGAWPVDKAYADAALEGRPINYGFSVGWWDLRKELLRDRWAALASREESARVIEGVRLGLSEGGLGIGLPLGYLPDSNRVEYLELAQLAAGRGVPTFTHVRTKNTHEPRGAVEGFGEVIAMAAATGAHMHICHVNSSALRETPRVLRMLAKARAQGLPISTEAYPWGAGATIISAPFLHPDNLKLIDISPRNILYLKTGERPASAERLAELRRQDPTGVAIVNYLDEAVAADRAILDQALLGEDVMIASDAVPYMLAGKVVTARTWPLPTGVSGHPRTAATFTKTLARYVRETGAMTIIDVFRRGSLAPARLLEPAAPDMRRKGRLQAGADADIIVFDPARVGGEAGFADPAKPAAGMRHVLVNGRFLIRDGKLRPNEAAGRPVRGRTTFGS